MKVNEWLLDIAYGRRNRVIIVMPPQQGKSTLISSNFPAWYVGTFPTRNVVLASYESSFAANWGMRARDIIAEYGPDVFGVHLSESVSARDGWRVEFYDRERNALRLGGGMNTGGAGGPLTGRTADLLLIDDPIKGPDEARSPSARESVWEWFQSVAAARLSHPDAPIVIVMTRWNVDDLVGRIQAQHEVNPEALPWDVLRLPAIAEEDDDPIGREIGEPLWPERWSLDALMRRKAGMSEYWWGAQYQGRPTPRGGGLLTREMFRIIEREPAGMEWVRSWDLASTEKSSRAKDPDYTAGARVADNDGRLVIADMKRGQWSPAAVEDELKRAANQDGRGTFIRIEREGGASGKLTASHLSRRVLRGFRVRFVSPSGSKVDRADLFVGMAENGNVDLVRGAWNEAFIQECINFPRGSHDDQVDAVSGGVDELYGKSEWKAF